MIDLERTQLLACRCIIAFRKACLGLRLCQAGFGASRLPVPRCCLASCNRGTGFWICGLKRVLKLSFGTLALMARLHVIEVERHGLYSLKQGPNEWMKGRPPNFVWQLILGCPGRAWGEAARTT